MCFFIAKKLQYIEEKEVDFIVKKRISVLLFASWFLPVDFYVHEILMQLSSLISIAERFCP